ncbi:Protein of unknown function [Thermodesulforhabdus norvegica]|uniref:Peptidoglycan beta-N-acetylmuramidase NamZ N-terminal domain-containing protein n=2 Tax=Thermodesulforhabdus norvegica TaxID=39841 RepID=A0A1I4VCD2_9BACT|nr:Protein of unknown function [Thermodesulforhabdus norvegica]
MAATVLGCDRLIRNLPRRLRLGSVALLCNQASVTGTLRPLPEELVKNGIRLRFILSPQHGFFSEKQANMIESGHEFHPALGIPIYSLYGPMFSPPPELFEDIDYLLVDLQDVGTRVYTYMTTMGLVLEALSGRDVRVIILDRPNPIGTDVVEGNVVEPGYRSFVGRYLLPMRHGLTPGEYALWVAMEKGLDVDIQVITMENWSPDLHHPETGLRWIFPSPNMPSYETALVYPGMVLLEGIVTPNWTGPVIRGKSGPGKGERDGRESRQAGSYPKMDSQS